MKSFFQKTHLFADHQVAKREKKAAVCSDTQVQSDTCVCLLAMAYWSTSSPLFFFTGSSPKAECSLPVEHIDVMLEGWFHFQMDVAVAHS